MWGATLCSGALSGWTATLLILVLLENANIINNDNWFGLMEPHLGKEGMSVLFSDAFNTFYLWLYGVGYNGKGPLSQRENTLPPLHGLLFSINSKHSFICTILQTVTSVMEHWLDWEEWIKIWNVKHEV